jgi:hypothetical protein
MKKSLASVNRQLTCRCPTGRSCKYPQERLAIEHRTYSVAQQERNKCALSVAVRVPKVDVLLQHSLLGPLRIRWWVGVFRRDGLHCTSALGAMTYSARLVLDARTLVVPTARAFLQAFAPCSSCKRPARDRATSAAYRMFLHGLYGAAGRQPGPHLVGARLPGVSNLLVQVLRHLQLSRDGHSGKVGCHRRLVGGHRRHCATPRPQPTYCCWEQRLRRCPPLDNSNEQPVLAGSESLHVGFGSGLQLRTACRGQNWPD